MKLFLTLLSVLACLTCRAQVPPVATLDTADTATGNGHILLPNLLVQAHQQLVTASSKGVKFGTGLVLEPGRQVAVFYANPDTLKSHMIRAISVLIDRKFSYGRLKVNLRLRQGDAPAMQDALPTSFYILPEAVTGHHTQLSFLVPEGFMLPKAGIFICIEGLTSAADEQFLRVVATPLKQPAADGSTKVALAVKTTDSQGQEHLFPLEEYPKLVASPIRADVASATWVKIAANPRYPFRRNVPTGLGSHTPVAYNVVTQLTFLSW